VDSQLLDQLVPLVAIVFGCAIVLIPIIGFTLRFALKPTMETWLQLKGQGPASSPQVEVLERRLASVEQQLEQMHNSFERITAERDFDRKLTAPNS
jgi:hypothetical protein